MSFYSRIFILIIALIFIICLSSIAQESRKIAVLYFTDHSNFDRQSGCGCISLGPLNFLFGSGQKKEKWDLKIGFRNLLNESLKEEGYNIIEPGHIDNIIKEAGTGNLALLADKLEADIMIIGDIKKFEQHRNRVSSHGYTSVGAGFPGSEQGTNMTLLGGIGGFHYSSTVKTNIKFYDNSGDEIDSSEIISKKDLQDFMIGMGPLSKSYQSGKAKSENENQSPIVDYKKLDQMQFGTDEFKNRTLFGLATMDVMKQIVAKVNEYIQPIKTTNATGKIIYIGDGKHLKENQAYVDIGAGDGIITGIKLDVYAETGSDSLQKDKIGVIQIIKVEAEHLSIAEILEGIGKVKKGDIVK